MSFSSVDMSMRHLVEGLCVNGFRVRELILYRRHVQHFITHIKHTIPESKLKISINVSNADFRLKKVSVNSWYIYTVYFN